MKSPEALAALSALAQESRLALFRLLVKRGAEGYCAGELAARLDIPAPTLSFHLRTLSQAGLVRSRRTSRFLHYSANLDSMSGLVAFLTAHCCSLATDRAAGSCTAVPAGQRKSLA